MCTGFVIAFTFALLGPKARILGIVLHIYISYSQPGRTMCREGVESSFQMFVHQFISVQKEESRSSIKLLCSSVYGSARWAHWLRIGPRSSKYCYAVSSLSRHLCFPDFWPGTEPGVPKCCGEAGCHDISNPTSSAGNLPRKIVFIGSQKACICQICLSRPNPAFLKFIPH